MTILGFSSAQTFETTSMEEIRKNFVYKMNMIASDNQKNSKSSKYTRRKQGSRQTELRQGRLYIWTKLSILTVTA